MKNLEVFINIERLTLNRPIKTFFNRVSNRAEAQKHVKFYEEKRKIVDCKTPVCNDGGSNYLGDAVEAHERCAVNRFGDVVRNFCHFEFPFADRTNLDISETKTDSSMNYTRNCLSLRRIDLAVRAGPF